MKLKYLDTYLVASWNPAVENQTKCTRLVHLCWPPKSRRDESPV